MSFSWFMLGVIIGAGLIVGLLLLFGDWEDPSVDDNPFETPVYEPNVLLRVWRKICH